MRLANSKIFGKTQGLKLGNLFCGSLNLALANHESHENAVDFLGICHYYDFNTFKAII